MKKYLSFLLLFVVCSATAQTRNPANKAIYLEDVSWTKARELLTPDAVVVIPLGAGSKEHGPHLPLATDYLQAEGYAKEIALQRKVLIAPIVSYGFYPAFLKYSGSTSINFETATSTVVQIVRSLAAYGPKRFYVVNIGVSTTPTLMTAAKTLAEEGILLYFSRYDRQGFVQAEQPFRTKSYSGHADELESSNLLHLRPDLVDMSKAVNDSSMKGKSGGMTPVQIAGGNLNTSGINGYAALATVEKGRKGMASFAKELIREIDSVRTCALPKTVDRTSTYASYVGNYVDKSGTELVISQKENKLFFLWNKVDTSNFFHLYQDAPDNFSSMNLNILFVRNDAGQVTKAWCQFRGTSFWVTKSN
jgi:creatinine amidohydrolase